MKIALWLVLFLTQCGLVATAQDTRYYDLRVYSVLPGKTEGVLERFRDFVNKVRARHGVETVGSWVAKGSTNDTYIYILSAPTKELFDQGEKAFASDPEFKAGYAANAEKHGKTLGGIRAFPMSARHAKLNFKSADKPRAFDLRLYTTSPGKTEAFWNRWREHATRLYQRQGLASVGFWKADKKDKDGNDQVIVLLAGDSVEAINAGIARFHQDEEWLKIERETEKDGKLRSSVEAFKMLPTDFSPLK